jgi:hypothetical protein
MYLLFDFWFFATRSRCKAEAGPELFILLPRALQCYNYRCEP